MAPLAGLERLSTGASSACPSLRAGDKRARDTAASKAIVKTRAVPRLLGSFTKRNVSRRIGRDKRRLDGDISHLGQRNVCLSSERWSADSVFTSTLSPFSARQGCHGVEAA